MADGAEDCRAHLAATPTNLSEYLSEHLSVTGANRAPLDAAREAVSDRILARRAPGEFELLPAVALGNVGNRLAVHLDRASGALAHADEAVGILRGLDEAAPHTFGRAIWRTGRTDEALLCFSAWCRRAVSSATPHSRARSK